MQSSLSSKILKIIDDIELKGNVNQTRLTVLKKWFERPGRMEVFGLWVARRAAAIDCEPADEAAAMLDEARALLGTAQGREDMFDVIDPEAGRSLIRRAKAFQNTYRNVPFNQVRLIDCWPLLLVEHGLEIHLGISQMPSSAYRLAVEWIENYNPSYGTGLNGPSVAKLRLLAGFISRVEAEE